MMYWLLQKQRLRKVDWMESRIRYRRYCVGPLVKLIALTIFPSNRLILHYWRHHQAVLNSGCLFLDISWYALICLDFLPRFTSLAAGLRAERSWLCERLMSRHFGYKANIFEICCLMCCRISSKLFDTSIGDESKYSTSPANLMPGPSNQHNSLHLYCISWLIHPVEVQLRHVMSTTDPASASL